MAHGTGVVSDLELPKNLPAEEDTEEIIDWKAQRALELARMKHITVQEDRISKLTPKTKDGQEDVSRASKVLAKEKGLCKQKVDHYTELIDHAYEVRRIRSILGGK